MTAPDSGRDDWIARAFQRARDQAEHRKTCACCQRAQIVVTKPPVSATLDSTEATR